MGIEIEVEKLLQGLETASFLSEPVLSPTQRKLAFMEMGLLIRNLSEEDLIWSKELINYLIVKGLFELVATCQRESNPNDPELLATTDCVVSRLEEVGLITICQSGDEFTLKCDAGSKEKLSSIAASFVIEDID